MSEFSVVAEAGKQEIIVTRSFDAPRVLVYKIMTDPEMIPHWWGPRHLTTYVDQMELSKGGIWRFVQYDADGNEYAFNGVYHEITPFERLVYTFEYEGMPGHIMLETVTLAGTGDTTTMTDQAVFQSVADRDGMLNAGMEGGVAETTERIADLLVELAAQPKEG